MSAAKRIRRPQRLGHSQTQPSTQERGTWIGVDLSSHERPRAARTLLPLLLLTLITALGIAALRIDLIRTRYALAAAAARENSLIEERRALIAHKRQLRDPLRLAIQARKRGFHPAARVFSLPDPSATTRPLPAVAAGPGTVTGTVTGTER